MSPVTDPGYNATKQARYRARLKSRSTDRAAAAVTSFTRAVLAKAHSTFENDRDAGRLVRSAWPDDRMALKLVTRAASALAMTTSTGWAAELATMRAEELLATFGPASCGARLLQQGTVLQFSGANKISIPGISTAGATFTSFVQQGTGIPVRQFATSAGVSLGPRKLATIFVLTYEMIAASHAEQLVRMVMTDSLGAALDTALFSNIAGDATRPPGLLVGVTPISAATGGGSAAMLTDISKLVAAVSPTCGMDIVFITDPGTVVKIALAAAPGFDLLGLPVLASNAVIAGTIICIGLPVLVSAFSDTPRIDASRDVESSVSMDTAPPTDIAGGGGTVIKSSYQTDTVAIRFISDVAWAVRTPSAVAVVNSITW
jgi:hypothetical protein